MIAVEQVERLGIDPALCPNDVGSAPRPWSVLTALRRPPSASRDGASARVCPMVPTYRGRKDAWRAVEHPSHRERLEVVNGGILTTFSQPTSDGRSRALV